jgi:hypothetical protein
MGVISSGQVGHKSWVASISILALVFGGLLALSLKTQDKIREEKCRPCGPINSRPRLWICAMR